MGSSTPFEILFRSTKSFGNRRCSIPDNNKFREIEKLCSLLDSNMLSNTILEYFFFFGKRYINERKIKRGKLYSCAEREVFKRDLEKA